jgi:hypothetical protein
MPPFENRPEEIPDPLAPRAFVVPSRLDRGPRAATDLSASPNAPDPTTERALRFTRPYLRLYFHAGIDTAP